MSEILTKAVWDGNTGQQTIVPLTAEEIAEREVMAAAAEAAEAERLAAEELKAAQKASVLGALAVASGLTVEEITAALGA